jgi:hypothetical protein
MKKTLRYFLLFIVATSCGPEEGETVMSYEFSSEISTQKVEILGYEDGNNSVYYSDSAASLSLKDFADRLYDSWPTENATISLPRDSILIIFNDSLKLVHLTLRDNDETDSLSMRGNILLFDDPRNIYKIESYDTERARDDRWTAHYTVTQSDLEYAIEVN